MYVLQDKPDEEATLENDVKFEPKATLKDEYGGIVHIATDDHCYVLYKRYMSDGKCRGITHWFKEAVEALKTLPLPE